MQENTLVIPDHVAFIMGGSEDWGVRERNDAMHGIKAGISHVLFVSDFCLALGTRILTVYAFPAKTWVLPEPELHARIETIGHSLLDLMYGLCEKGAHIGLLGNSKGPANPLLNLVEGAVDISKSNHLWTLNLLLNYGSRDELLQATKRIIEDGLAPHEVTNETLNRYLYSETLAPPELVIRTGGAAAPDSIMLWEAADTISYTTETLWPDVTHSDLLGAFAFYSSITRAKGLNSSSRSLN